MSFPLQECHMPYDMHASHEIKNASFVLALPSGKQAFVWFHENKCTLFEYNSIRKQIETSSEVEAFVDASLYNGPHGTVLYGKLFTTQNVANRCFCVEDIYFFQGNKCFTPKYADKLNMIKHMFEEYVSTFATTSSQLLIGMPCIASSVHELKQLTPAYVPVEYKYKCGQTSKSWLQTLSTSHINKPYNHMPNQSNNSYSKQPPQNKPYNNHPPPNKPYNQPPQNKPYNQPPPQNKPYNQPPPQNKPYNQPPPQNKPYNQPPQNKPYNHLPPQNKPYNQPPPQNKPYNHTPFQNKPYNQQSLKHPSVKRFIVKADIEPDVYHLYTPEQEYVGVACVPSLETSMKLNRLFRFVKENDRLDAIEESDDEDEFEDSRTDKFVQLDKSCFMECTYHPSFKKWQPLHVVY